MMHEPNPSETDGARDTAGRPVAVAVRRTGGFAGLTKQWRAEPPQAEASEWIALIAQCPWDSASARQDAAEGPSADGRPPAGADGFTWWIQARCGEQEEHEARLADEEMVGAWRELVDAVRRWSSNAGA